MLNAQRPRRPSLSTSQPAETTSTTASFRYSTSRPRFSTNPSRRTSGSQEPVPASSAKDGVRNMSIEEPQSGWTEGQYPGPPLPARPPGTNLTALPPTPADTSISGRESSRTNDGTNGSSSSVTGRAAAMSHATTSTERAAPMDVADSARTSSSRTNRRPLPPRPHPPALDQIPAWEPDVKAHIPPNVTLDSRQAAYAQQGNPPPLLRTAIDARQDPKRDRAGMLRRPAVNGIVILQEGPKGGGGGSLRGSKDRKGKGKVDILGLGNENRGGIAGEYVLDPSLPFALPEDAVDLSRSRSDLQGGTKRKRGSIDGERPSAIFKTEGGDVDLRLSVVNEETMRGDDMGSSAEDSGKRVKKARVEVNSVRGHIRVDLVKIDKGRTASIEISSKAGNLFIQIPENFRGPIHCATSAAQPTILLPSMRQRAKILSTHRGETTCYLGTPPAKTKNIPPLLPPRRFSNRLRERPSGSSLAQLPETPQNDQNQNQMYDSPPPMDVDGFRMPSPSQMAHSASSTFIPTSGPGGNTPNPPQRSAGLSKVPPVNGDETPESSLYLSSYMGAITLGIYGLEPEHTFKGATTLSGLVQNLGDIKGEMKRKVREKVGQKVGL